MYSYWKQTYVVILPEYHRRNFGPKSGGSGKIFGSVLVSMLTLSDDVYDVTVVFTIVC